MTEMLRIFEFKGLQILLQETCYTQGFILGPF